MLCCHGIEVKYYDFTLGRLAYESLRLVQNSGNTIAQGDFMIRGFRLRSLSYAETSCCYKKYDGPGSSIRPIVF